MTGSKFPSFTHPALIKTINPEGDDSVNRQKEEYISILLKGDPPSPSSDIGADGPAKDQTLTGTDLVHKTSCLSLNVYFIYVHGERITLMLLDSICNLI